MFAWYRRFRRRRIMQAPFPTWWEACLVRNVGHYRRLTSEQQIRLRRHATLLFHEKSWEGVGGLFLTDEIKITIAAQASLLLLGCDDIEPYRRISSIVIHPHVFHTPVEEDGWEDDFLSDRLISGQAVYRGPVILNWEEILQEGRHPEQGHNVILHEFAHQLDFLTGEINGTPPLKDRQLGQDWQPIMQAAFDEHRQHLQRGQETLFTEHAAENETEFFADVTEVFFCQPRPLAEENPRLYSLMARYYGVQPLIWFAE